MINQLTVLNTVSANGASAMVDNNGNLNVTGISMPIPAATVLDVQRLPSNAEQIKRQRISFSSVNSYTYVFTIKGYSLSSGVPVTQVISWTSSASNSTALTSAAITALVNSYADFNVEATDIGSGVVALAGVTATATCPNAPIFDVYESDPNITPTAVASVSFTAAPTGGRTATGIPVINDAGAVTGIIITDGGMGYLAAPTATVSNGGGTSGSATTILFEGEVVQIGTVTAGSGYVGRPGVLVQGTPAAIIAKYGYVASTPNSPGAPDYPALANLTSGATYTEWIISYQVSNISGITTFAQTTGTNQISILVNESATNAASLNSVWGTLWNLRKGYTVSIVDSGASNTAGITAATGAVVYTAGGSPALGAVSLGIIPRDILVVGTGVIPSATGGGVGLVVANTSNTAGFVQFGLGNVATDVSAAVYQLVRRTPIVR